ncbi:LiaF transmembrane domain-containing protein [Lentilactobacillus kisonensis]|uniref:LiaF transmembrane domain-containing protein n=2 Tax=Lentilactobacillus kisonensis TaxID=481722 RepID=H1LE15_9LACO|nr:hypothetical protein [Lentilactobacillus kisonensis]EHO52805.1 hypothetical protein HMPREF9104_00841 [Lentilactobacillus kisonensis F0435]KRL22532.1 hypothetical protein FC98_GL002420 [Lentilactobacillus kisonensis DSM 19906 = JCM 15041]
MSRINKHQLIVGIAFLAGAISWLGVSMGWLNFKISVTTIVLTIILAIVLLSSLVDRSIAGTVFSLAFLSMLYAGPLGITHLVPWSILGIALLITIGLSIIFHPKRRWHRWSDWIDYDGRDGDYAEVDDEINTGNQSDSVIDTTMSDTVRYIESDDFKQVRIHASMGGVKAYFDKAVIIGDSAKIQVEGYMCDIKLFVPKDWEIINHINPNMSGVEIINNNQPHEGPKVYLTGKLNLGNLQVYYI